MAVEFLLTRNDDMNARFSQEIHNMQVMKFIWDLCLLVSPQEGAVRMGNHLLVLSRRNHHTGRCVYRPGPQRKGQGWR